jgi:1,4-dihydroxy-2-naphthoate octaprenyltransferase
MKPSVQSWIGAMRLRTLPLAASSILAGTALVSHVNWWLFVLTLLTCLSLQVLSNLANDYGDFSKGTDNEHRVGPERALQSGAISEPQMRRALFVNAALSLALGVGLLLFAYSKNRAALPLIGLFVMGLAAIAAAVKYTVGRSAYGYRGFGDLFVMVFFGFVGVLGTAMLQRLVHGETWIYTSDFLPALSVGSFACMVLNLNNLRDHVNDAQSGKMTLVVKLGFEGGKRYHFVLWTVAVLASGAWVIENAQSPYQWIYVVVQLVLGLHLIKVFAELNPAKLDPFLKLVAIGSFVSSLLMLLLA